MKITGVELLTFSHLHDRHTSWMTKDFRAVKADAAVVRISTDEGVEGIGEGSPHGNLELMADWTRFLAPLLIGQDPTDPAVAPHPNGRSDAYDCTVGGIDMALWDLRAKAAGRRLADLLSEVLGTRAASAARVYASGGCRYDWRGRPEDVIDEVAGYADLGYTACKIRMGTAWEFDGVTPERFLALMRNLVREANGRMELMVDAGCRLTREDALTVARGLDELGFAWLEEPLPRDDVDGYARLNAAVDMHITGGEDFTTLEKLAPYLKRGAISIAQPDTGSCGISEVLRIVQVAGEYGVQICPHSWHNGVMAVGNAHLVAALPHDTVLELGMHHGPLQWGIVDHPPVVAGGRLELPDRPGIGVGVAADAAERFPLVQGNTNVLVVR